MEVKIRWVPSLGLHAYCRHVFVDGVCAGRVAGEWLAGRVVGYVLAGQVVGYVLAGW